MPSTATSILDGLSTSVAVKAPCRTVATSNITLAGLQTISGYTTVENDRVLVKGQTNPVDNGIYMASTGNWTRAKDADGNRDLVQGTIVLVRSGVVDGAIWELTTANPIVIGTSSLVFELRDDPAITYAQTEPEITAGVTPTNYTKWASPWKDISRFVSDNTGVTDVSIQFNNALLAEKNIIIPEGEYLIGSSLIYRDNMRIEGSGYLNTKIKASFAGSVFRSSFGESPAIGQRPLGVHLAKFAIFPATAATITSGSIGINLRNAQYSSVRDVLMQYFDIGVATDQIAQYLEFHRLIVQVANTGFYGESIGGGNRLIGCDIGGKVVAIDLNGGAWDIFGTTAEALETTTDYCVRVGRPGGQGTVIHAAGLYVEGTDASIITLQVENSVTRSTVTLHRHSTLGSIVNNAGENCEIHVPGQGYYNPLYRAQRIEFASSIDGSAQAGLRSNGGNALESRNAANTGYAYHYANNFLASRVAITYSASMTPDASLGLTQVITVTNTTAFTINSPTNGLAAGHRLMLQIRNQSSGVMGAITWGGSYKRSAWTNPADGFHRCITFEFDGTSSWTQISQTGVDIPN